MQPIELKARREALGLHHGSLADYLSLYLGFRFTTSHIARMEAGNMEIPPETFNEALDNLEAITDDLTATMIEDCQRAGGNPILCAPATDEGLRTTLPDLAGSGMCAATYRVAVARATNALRALGQDVPIVVMEG